MTIESYKVLNDLLKCQVEEGSKIHIEYEKRQISCVELNKWKSKVIKFRYSTSKMESILTSLMEKGYIKSEDDRLRILTITHAGNHMKQRRAEQFAQFLFRSILVPIVVALLTSFFYNLFFG